MTSPSPADVERAVTRLREWWLVLQPHEAWTSSEQRYLEVLILLLDAREEIESLQGMLDQDMRCLGDPDPLLSNEIYQRINAVLVRWAGELT